MPEPMPPGIASADAPGRPAHVLRLLPAGTGIPLRYRQIVDLLHTWGVPEDLVQLGLVMRWVERGVVAPAQIGALLGAEAGAAAEALAALNAAPRAALRSFEPTWKLFMLTYLAPAASVLKIAELLMHLRHSQDADVAFSTEMIGAAAGVCARLGMWDVRSELLDARMRLDDPHLLEGIRKQLDISHAARIQFFDEVRQQLEQQLAHQQIPVALIERTPRRLSHIINEGQESMLGAFPWADAITLLIEDVADCYRALGAINIAYPVIGAKLRDYIGGPRENGYQAIHTTIEFSDPSSGRSAPVDIRIQTSAMHRYNRDGYLAYLAGVAPPARRQLWWSDRRRWLDAYAGRSSELFVFTPLCDVIFLPRGATVLDFAVRVHRDLGAYCRGALLNGVRVGPGERLERGDICEVLIDQHGQPIDQRLIDLASTRYAKSSIRRALLKDTSGAARGRQRFHDLLAQRLAEQEAHASTVLIEQQVAAICRARGYHSVDVFYRAVARGEVAPDHVIRAIVDGLLIPRLDLDAVPPEIRASARQIWLALCCRPRPSQPALAVPVHAGHQIKIHSAGCARAVGLSYPVAWRPAEEQAFVAEVLYEGWDRPGLIHRLTEALYSIGGLNIRSLTADVPEPSLARIRFTFETPQRQTLEQVLRALEALPEQRHVEMRTVSLIDEGFRITTPLANPYGPQPVGRRPFFVGRVAQVRQMLAQLDGPGARHMLVRGPKRIGKSSLLAYVERYHFDHLKAVVRLDLQGLPTEDLRFDRLLGRLARMLAQQAGARALSSVPDARDLAYDPIRVFSQFVATLRGADDLDRLVILLDELGVVISRLRGSGREHEFFDQWRALLNSADVAAHLACIAVLPDYALGRGLAERESIDTLLRIGELGYPIRLTVLDSEDARDLITAPVKMHLEYAPEDLALLLDETGCHPYYIHLVCSQIVTEMQLRQRKTGRRFHERQLIPRDVIDGALQAVCSNEDAFHHLLADSTPDTAAVLRAVAAHTSDADRYASAAHMRAWVGQRWPGAGAHTIAWALDERPDLLVEQNGWIGLRVALAARWLRLHSGGLT